MVSRIANPETIGSSWGRVLASGLSAGRSNPRKAEKKDPKNLQTEANKSCRINKTSRKKAQNEPN